MQDKRLGKPADLGRGALPHSILQRKHSHTVASTLTLATGADRCV